MKKNILMIIKSIAIVMVVFLMYTNTLYAADNNKNQIITPEQFGAVGDGIVDDTKAMYNTFRYAGQNAGVTICFGAKKNYLISSGLTLPKTCIVDGNDSKITVKEIKSYTEGGNYSYQFFSEYKYNEHMNLVDWKNLTIDFSPTLLLNSAGKTKEYMLFRFHDLECFRMNNVNIISNGDERNCINLFKFSGQGKIYMDNCSFDIRHRGKVGSILWIQSTMDNGYYARISNCKFFSTCSDEIISAFCSGSHDIVFNGCDIEKRFYDTYYDSNQVLGKTWGPFINSVYQSKDIPKDTGITHMVTYQNCNLKYGPINENSEIYNTFCGLNSYYGDVAITKFLNCNIVASNIKSLVGGEQAVNNQFVTNIDSNEDFHNNIKAVFDSCNIAVKTSKYGLMTSNSSNLEISNSSIVTNKMIDYIWANERTVTEYQLKLVNNNISVTEANDFLFNVNKRAKEQYILINNNFIVQNAKSDLKLLKEDNSSKGYDDAYYTHDLGSFYNFYAINNKINNINIKDMNQY